MNNDRKNKYKYKYHIFWIATVNPDKMTSFLSLVFKRKSFIPMVNEEYKTECHYKELFLHISRNLPKYICQKSYDSQR